jgi:hypothetical protein
VGVTIGVEQHHALLSRTADEQRRVRLFVRLGVSVRTARRSNRFGECLNSMHAAHRVEQDGVFAMHGLPSVPREQGGVFVMHGLHSLPRVQERDGVFAMHGLPSVPREQGGGGLPCTVRTVCHAQSAIGNGHRGCSES